MITDKELCNLCIKDYENREPTGRVNDLEFTILDYKFYTVLIIRGTEFTKWIHGLFTGKFLDAHQDFLDIIRDIRIFPWYNKEIGWGHAGFLRGAKALADNIEIKSLSRGKPLILTGHSLGAIISLQLARFLSNRGYNVVEWVGFGCPKGTIGVHTVPFYSISYENYKDPVCNILLLKLLGYTLPTDNHTMIGVKERAGHSIEYYYKAL